MPIGSFSWHGVTVKRGQAVIVSRSSSSVTRADGDTVARERRTKCATVLPYLLGPESFIFQFPHTTCILMYVGALFHDGKNFIATQSDGKSQKLYWSVIKGAKQKSMRH